jgi:hypothetical protein
VLGPAASSCPIIAGNRAGFPGPPRLRIASVNHRSDPSKGGVNQRHLVSSSTLVVGGGTIDTARPADFRP